jgi:hypothetical protein
MVFSKYYYFFILLIFSSFSFSQEKFSIALNWSDKSFHSDSTKLIQLPTCDGVSFDGYKPIYSKFLSNTNLISVNHLFTVTHYIPLTDKELKYINKYQLTISDSIISKTLVRNNRNNPTIIFTLYPYFLNNGIPVKIVSGEITITPFASSEMKNTFVSPVKRNVTNNSKLSSGDWFKLYISETGVYRLDYKYLTSNLGISLPISFNSLHIYGNGLGQLPELNSLNKTDDLKKNSIKIIDRNSNGNFDSDDYLEFFAKGPKSVTYSSSIFQENVNIYSDYSCYFLKVGVEAIQPLVKFNSIETYTAESDEFDFFFTHEVEDTSIMYGGQRWYGEVFDDVLSHEFRINLPSIPSSNIKLNLSLASNSRESGNLLKTYANSALVSSTSLPKSSIDFVRYEFTNSLNLNSSNLILNLTMERKSPSVITFLDKFTLNARCKNNFVGSNYSFRDLNSVGVGKITKFSISNSNSRLRVLCVTNPINSIEINPVFSDDTLFFVFPTDSLHEFYVYDTTFYKVPFKVESIENQNLHGLNEASLLIISPKVFMSQAERLANIHRNLGDITHVVELEKIYNEFSCGVQDPTAIKLFVKMIYDRYKNDSLKSLKNLLLFGDGTFDPKNRTIRNNNFIPTYQFLASENHIDAMVSDDYYGMMDDNESISSSDLMDIGVGRLLISSIEQAQQQIDKIEAYISKGLESTNEKINKTSYGSWRTKYTLITDDEEDGYFVVQDAEPQSKEVRSSYPELNCEKIYCDAYQQVVEAGGERYPQVNEAIINSFQEGSLIINYTGHGGEVGAAEERIITIGQVQSLSNPNKLPLFVSSTCEFTKYDDPTRVSVGEWLSLNPNGGAIALMTTTRPVYFGVNSATGKYFFENVFDRDSNKSPLTFGEIFRRTKNLSGSNNNKRSFTLIGDPALRIALPQNKVIIDSINENVIQTSLDTLNALSKVRFRGHVEDFKGKLILSNGEMNVTLFDKSKEKFTLGQDPTSPVIPFKIQNNILYRGRASISNGVFSFDCILPKDIDYSYGKGKLSLYGNLINSDAIGVDESFYIGGYSKKPIFDSVGPTIKSYLNNSNFVDGGIADQNPKLIIELKDSSGLNISGNGIGHDLMAVLDGNTSNPIVLNTYYSADLNSYKSGKVVYALSNLSEGEHTLKIKAWDVLNNSNEESIHFHVKNSSQVELDRVYNYPNPFTNSTTFMYDYNQNKETHTVKIYIYTVTGKLVKILEGIQVNGSNSSRTIHWDGKDEFGDKLARGVYVYTLKIINANSEIAEKTEKLVLF